MGYLKQLDNNRTETLKDEIIFYEKWLHICDVKGLSDSETYLYLMGILTGLKKALEFNSSPPPPP